MVFIRAPRITRVGAEVEVLAKRDNFATLVRQGLVLAATFHPEMTNDVRVPELFLENRPHAQAGRAESNAYAARNRESLVGAACE